MILVVRTDKPEAEIGFYLVDGTKCSYKVWPAHRELSETIHTVMLEELTALGKTWSDVTGIIFYKGPGSFTGLRIGAAIVNAFAVAQNIPVVGTNGEQWIQDGLAQIANGKTELALPEYGSDPRITQQKK